MIDDIPIGTFERHRDGRWTSRIAAFRAPSALHVRQACHRPRRVASRRRIAAPDGIPSGAAVKVRGDAVVKGAGDGNRDGVVRVAMKGIDAMYAWGSDQGAVWCPSAR
jgi:hypothetical protein